LHFALTLTLTLPTLSITLDRQVQPTTFNLPGERLQASLCGRHRRLGLNWLAYYFFDTHYVFTWVRLTKTLVVELADWLAKTVLFAKQLLPARQRVARTCI
jgi:hypothetical protein